MQEPEKYELDPNFAVVCSFLEKFGKHIGEAFEQFSIEEFKAFLGAKKLDPKDLFVKLHSKLLTGIGEKKPKPEDWAKGVIKFCNDFPDGDNKLIRELGYANIPVSAKLRILKNLCEDQFEYNDRFNCAVNEEIEAGNDIRHQPLGKDKLGRSYWFMVDTECEVRLFRGWRNSLTMEETWNCVGSELDDIEDLIEILEAAVGKSPTKDAENEKSMSEDEAAEEGTTKLKFTELKQEDPVLQPLDGASPIKQVSNQDIVSTATNDAANAALYFSSIHNSPLFFKKPKPRSKKQILLDEKKHDLPHCEIKLSRLTKKELQRYSTHDKSVGNKETINIKMSVTENGLVKCPTVNEKGDACNEVKTSKKCDPKVIETKMEDEQKKSSETVCTIPTVVSKHWQDENLNEKNQSEIKDDEKSVFDTAIKDLLLLDSNSQSGNSVNGNCHLEKTSDTRSGNQEKPSDTNLDKQEISSDAIVEKSSDTSVDKQQKISKGNGLVDNQPVESDSLDNDKTVIDNALKDLMQLDEMINLGSPPSKPFSPSHTVDLSNTRVNEGNLTDTSSPGNQKLVTADETDSAENNGKGSNKSSIVESGVISDLDDDSETNSRNSKDKNCSKGQEGSRISNKTMFGRHDSFQKMIDQVKQFDSGSDTNDLSSDSDVVVVDSNSDSNDVSSKTSDVNVVDSVDIDTSDSDNVDVNDEKSNQLFMANGTSDVRKIKKENICNQKKFQKKKSKEQKCESVKIKIASTDDISKTNDSIEFPHAKGIGNKIEESVPKPNEFDSKNSLDSNCNNSSEENVKNELKDEMIIKAENLENIETKNDNKVVKGADEQRCIKSNPKETASTFPEDSKGNCSHFTTVKAEVSEASAMSNNGANISNKVDEKSYHVNRGNYHNYLKTVNEVSLKNELPVNDFLSTVFGIIEGKVSIKDEKLETTSANELKPDKTGHASIGAGLQKEQGTDNCDSKQKQTIDVKDSFKEESNGDKKKMSMLVGDELIEIEVASDNSDYDGNLDKDFDTGFVTEHDWSEPKKGGLEDAKLKLKQYLADPEKPGRVTVKEDFKVYITNKNKKEVTVGGKFLDDKAAVKSMYVNTENLKPNISPNSAKRAPTVIILPQTGSNNTGIQAPSSGVSLLQNKVIPGYPKFTYVIGDNGPLIPTIPASSTTFVPIKSGTALNTLLQTSKAPIFIPAPSVSSVSYRKQVPAIPKSSTTFVPIKPGTVLTTLMQTSKAPIFIPPVMRAPYVSSVSFKTQVPVNTVKPGLVVTVQSPTTVKTTLPYVTSVRSSSPNVTTTVKVSTSNVITTSHVSQGTNTTLESILPLKSIVPQITNPILPNVNTDVKKVTVVIGKDGVHYNKETGKPFIYPQKSSFVIAGPGGKYYDKETGFEMNVPETVKNMLHQPGMVYLVNGATYSEEVIKKNSSKVLSKTVKPRLNMEHGSTKKARKPRQKKKRGKIESETDSSDAEFEKMLITNEESDAESVDASYDYEKISKHVKAARQNKALPLRRSSSDAEEGPDEETDDDLQFDDDVDAVPVVLGRNAKRAAAMKRINYAEPKNIVEITDESSDDVEIIDDTEPCKVCNMSNDPSAILLCDKCDGGYHMSCLNPPLSIVPLEDWFCPLCEHNMLIVALKEKLGEMRKAQKKLHRQQYRISQKAFSINSDNIVEGERRSCRARKEVSYNESKYDKMITKAVNELNNEKKRPKSSDSSDSDTNSNSRSSSLSNNKHSKVQHKQVKKSKREDSEISDKTSSRSSKETRLESSKETRSRSSKETRSGSSKETRSRSSKETRPSSRSENVSRSSRKTRSSGKEKHKRRKLTNLDDNSEESGSDYVESSASEDTDSEDTEPEDEAMKMGGVYFTSSGRQTKNVSYAV